MERRNARPHVVIVGGGISGLAAAFFLRDEAVRVTVLEGSPRLGGKLSVSEIGGIAVDEGAEALLATRPEGTGLIGEVGLVRSPALAGHHRGADLERGRIPVLPRRQFMGVPADLGELAATGILSADGLARAEQDLKHAGRRSGRGRVGGEQGRRPVRCGACGPGRGAVAGWRVRRARSADCCRSRATLPGAGGQASRQHRSLAEAAAICCCRRPAPGARHRRRRQAGWHPALAPISVHHARRRPGHAARRRWRRRRGRRCAPPTMVRELARTLGSGWRLTVRVGGGAGAVRRRRGDHSRSRRGPASQAARRDVPGVVRRGHGVRRDQLREHGDRHARVSGSPPFPAPASPPSAGAVTWCLPWTGRAVKACHLLHREVAAPGRRDGIRSRTPGDRPLLGRPASARKRCCSGPTMSSPRWPRRNSRRRPGCAARRRPPG